MVKRAYQLLEFTQEWLKNPKYTDYQTLFKTQDGRPNVKYVMEVLTRFRYWTLWMSKRHQVTLHYIITVYHDMFNHGDSDMPALAENKNRCKKDLFFAMKFARQNLSKYYAEVTPKIDILLISAHILHPFRKLWSFRKWDKWMDIVAENETSYTT